MTEADPQPRVDAKHPWPALLSFREDDQRYFGGRDEEVEALYRRIGASRLTLLFGLSGLGKSSLLRAGLFPRLRREHYFPVYIRLRYGRDLPAPVEQIKAEIVAQARASGVDAPQPYADETLWQYFHRADADFWDERNYPSIPVLVFDQFEELFTKSRDVPEQANEVIEQLADLAEGASPAMMRDAAERNPSLLRQVFDDRYRLLLGIRSDYLAQLQGISDRVRAVFANRYELHRMSGAAALKSTLTAGGHLMEEEVARRVVRFVAGAKEEEGALSVEGLEVEPALLSLVCSELNATRIRNGEPKITASMLSGSKDEILSRFYEASFAEVAAELRVLVEDKLVTRDGKGRNFISEQTARETPGVTEEDLAKLVHLRLLRFEESGTSRRMELTHDLLTRVAAASRSTREHRLQLEESERARAEAERREATARRSLRRSRAAMLAFLVLAAVIAAQFIAAGRKARAADRIESNSAFGLAQQKLSSEEPAEGLALLARAVRLDPGNSAARTLLYEQLATRSWPVPIRTFGPPGRIAATAFSEDGERVAFLVGQTVEMWDIAKGQRIDGPVDAGFEPANIAFAGDGWTLLLDPGYGSGAADRAVWWNPRAGRVMTFGDARNVPGLSGCQDLQVFDLSSDGTELVVRCNGDLLIAPLRGDWPNETYSLQTEIAGDILGSRFARDPRFVIVRDSYFSQSLLDRRRQSPGRALLTPREEGVLGISRDGKRVALVIGAVVNPKTGDLESGPVEARDVESWKALGNRFNNGSSPLTAVFDRTGSTIMTTAEDGGIRLWDVEYGQMLFEPLRHAEVRHADFSADGARIFTASDRLARAWSRKGGAPLSEPLVQPKMLAAQWDSRGNLVTVSTAARVWRIANAVLPPVLAERVAIDFGAFDRRQPVAQLSADRTMAIVRDKQQKFAGFDGASGRRQWTSPADVGIVAFDPKGERAAVVSDEGVLSFVDARTWKSLWTLRDRVPWDVACSFSADGTTIVLEEVPLDAAKQQSAILVLDAATGERRAALEEAKRSFILMSRDGSLLALAEKDGVMVWDVRQGRALRTIPATGWLSSAHLEFSPDGQELAVLSSKSLDIWEIATGTKRAAKLEEGEQLVAGGFSPDGRRLIVISENNVALCDSRTLDCTKDVLGHAGVKRAEFSEDGERVLTVNENDMRVWEVATKRPLILPLPRSHLAVLSPDGTSLFIVRNEQLARVPLPSIDDADAARLADLGEALAGVRVDRLGVAEAIEGTKVLADLTGRCQGTTSPACDLVRRLRSAQ